MNTKRNVTIAICLTAILALSPVASFAQATTTFTGVGGLVAADVVKSNSSAACSGGQATVTGNAELVGLVAAGQSVLVSNPNLVISLPGGISLIVNEQTSSAGGNAGSINVNALHVKGPSIDIVALPPSPVPLARDNS